MVGQNKGENCTMNRILIIDDDRELCALIKRSVQTENIAADFCNTGKEGLQKLKEQEYQLPDTISVQSLNIAMQRSVTNGNEQTTDRVEYVDANGKV